MQQNNAILYSGQGQQLLQLHDHYSIGMHQHSSYVRGSTAERIVLHRGMVQSQQSICLL